MKRLACCLGAALLAVPAWGQDAAEPDVLDPAGLFDRLDKNADGQIAEDEVGEDSKRLFERLKRDADKDANGQLSKEEFVAGLEEKPAEAAPPAAQPAPGGRGQGGGFFSRMDTNGDGKVAPDEVPEDRREGFRGMLAQADKDGDGALTLEEFSAIARQFRRGQGGQAGQPGQPGQGFGGGGFGPSPLARALDANGDGELSAEEIAGAAEALKKLDADGDGKLSRQEMSPPRGGGFGQPGGGEAAAGRFVDQLMQADADSDGKLSKDEAPEYLKQGFDRVDANQDGFIDRDEARQIRFGGGGEGGSARAVDRVMQADADGDGKLSKEEAPERMRPTFDQIDGNKDGFVDRDEVRQMMADFRGGQGRSAFERLRPSDTNGDGKISKEEAPEFLKENFDRIDANQDGQLEESEVRQGFRGGRDRQPEGQPEAAPPADARRRERQRPLTAQDGEARKRRVAAADQKRGAEVKKARDERRKKKDRGQAKDRKQAGENAVARAEKKLAAAKAELKRARREAKAGDNKGRDGDAKKKQRKEKRAKAQEKKPADAQE